MLPGVFNIDWTTLAKAYWGLVQENMDMLTVCPFKQDTLLLE